MMPARYGQRFSLPGRNAIHHQRLPCTVALGAAVLRAARILATCRTLRELQRDSWLPTHTALQQSRRGMSMLGRGGVSRRTEYGFAERNCRTHDKTEVQPALDHLR